MKSGFKVMKFGGTSVGSAERLERVAGFVEEALRHDRIGLVASALSGVTDILVKAVAAAVAGRGDEVAAAVTAFRERHAGVVAELAAALGQERRAAVEADLGAIAGELDERLRGVLLLRDCSPRVEAGVVTLGERAVAVILPALLAARGIEPLRLDPVEVVPCQGDPLEGTPRPDEMAERLRPVREGDARLVFLPGFYGGDARGQVVCLGRGGSDYSAALLAQALAARELEIWTDVDGIFTTDPRLAPAAALLESLSFEEALELAHFGAKVLHPRTIAPARAAGLPVVIRDSFNPAHPGTRVEARQRPPEMVACGISFLRGVVMVTLSGPGMPGVPGFAARLFGALAQHRLSVILITQGSSETAITFAVEERSADEAVAALASAFEAEIATGRVEAIDLRRDLAIVSLVGDGMRERVGVAARFFGALGEARVSVAAIAQGASERSICAVVASADGAAAVRAIHRRFFEGSDGRASNRKKSVVARSYARRLPFSFAPSSAFAPAGIGNFAAGFDVLGAAVVPVDGELWGDVVEARPGAGETDRLELDGRYAARLPENSSDNLVMRARDAFARRLGEPLPPIDFRLVKGLPVASGLGSSAASVAATLVALNEGFGGPLDETELLAAAGEAEAAASGAVHLDNVAPILLGGLRLIDPRGKAQSLPFPDDLLFVLFVPELELTTRAARSVLPRDLPLADAVAWGQNLAGLVAALHAGDRELLRDTLRDSLAEPHRAPLVHGFREVQAAALASGALGCSLSGAGPSIFAVAESGDAEGIGRAGVAAWAESGVAATARLCRLDPDGARRVG